MLITAHFFSETASLLKFDSLDEYFEISSNNPLRCSLEDNCTIVTVFPICDSTCNKTAISFSAKLCNNNGKLYSPSPYLKVTDYGAGNYKIDLSAPLIPKSSLTTQSLVCDSLRVDIKDNFVYLSNNTNKNIFSCEFNLDNAKLQNLGNFYQLSSEEQNDTKIFITTNLQVAFIGNANKIEYDGKNIITLTHKNDIAQHGVVCTYANTGDYCELKEKYFVYLKEAPIVPATEYALPWAFIEAISVENYQLARNYLHPTLANNLTEQNIKDYFGDFIEGTHSLDNDYQKIALIYPGNPNFIKLFSFEIKDNRIQNIDCN